MSKNATDLEDCSPDVPVAVQQASAPLTVQGMIDKALGVQGLPYLTIKIKGTDAFKILASLEDQISLRPGGTPIDLKRSWLQYSSEVADECTRIERAARGLPPEEQAEIRRLIDYAQACLGDPRALGALARAQSDLGMPSDIRNGWASLAAWRNILDNQAPDTDALLSSYKNEEILLTDVTDVEVWVHISRPKPPAVLRDSRPYHPSAARQLFSGSSFTPFDLLPGRKIWLSDIKIPANDAADLAGSLTIHVMALVDGGKKFYPEDPEKFTVSACQDLVSECRRHIFKRLDASPGFVSGTEEEDTLLRRSLRAALDYLAACCGDIPAMERLGTGADHPSDFLPEADAARRWKILARARIKMARDLERALFTSNLSLERAGQWIFAGTPLGYHGEKTPTHDPEASAPAPVPSSTPLGRSTIILKTVGDPNSEKGMDIAARYASLMTPLPLLVAKVGEDVLFDTLQDEFPWMEEANDAMADAVAMCAQGHAPFFCPPMLLAGAPGIGKTRWSRRISEILGLHFDWMSCSGTSTSLGLSGVERGYTTARAGFAPESILSAGSANPILMLDEIDKCGHSNHGDVITAVLPLLEAETSCRFRDNFFLAPVNLSHISWMMTANETKGLPGPFMTRIRVVNCRIPTEAEALRLVGPMSRDIARVFFMPESCIPEFDMKTLARAYAQGGLLRDLRTAILAQMASALRPKRVVRTMVRTGFGFQGSAA